VLYIWTAQGWAVASDQARPWYYAFSSSYGLYQAPLEGGTWHAQSGNAFRFLPYNGLRPGYYGVMNYMYWSWGRTSATQWSGWCQVT
jgi:hypothetical protein